MRRLLVWGGLLGLIVGTALLGAPVGAQTFDIGKALAPSFADVALLPTRLTYYNLHDDSARATYTCCKPSQEEQIRKALAANAAFLERYPRTDFSDDTCMHNFRVNSVRKNFRYQVEALETLLRDYPDSDLADDAAWRLAQCYIADKDHQAALGVLNRMLKLWPTSAWADDALYAITGELRALEDDNEAFRALQDLAYKYPSSDHCPEALYQLAVCYQGKEDYTAAINAARDLIRRYPCSDFADDAQVMVADALRHEGRPSDALDEYRSLIERMPGSTLCNQAMREANTLIRNLGRAAGRHAKLYETRDDDTGREAQDLYDLAKHYENYREYGAAVRAYDEFIRRFPGHDCYDDALYNIGMCYQNLNILFQDLNKAKGPEDLFKLKGDWEDATGRYDGLPTPGQLSAVGDAAAAFSIVVDRLVGSPLRDDALYEIARAYEDSGRAGDEAYSYQELVITFPGSEHEFEALYRMLKWYADPKNWDVTQLTYPQLARAFPNLFPLALLQDKDAFYTVIGAYSRHLNFAWFESFDHHIPYDLTIDDLGSDGDFYLGTLLAERGDYKTALRRLHDLCYMPTNDLAAPAIWVSGQIYLAQGKPDEARKYFQELLNNFEWSGLADDARMALDQLDAPRDTAPYLEQVSKALGRTLQSADVYVGDKVVVIAPYVVAAKLREYNMPNIWENAVGLMADWTGTTPDGKLVVFVDPKGGANGGNPVVVPATGIADPPQWSLGLDPIARNFVDKATGETLGDMKATFCAALSRFAAASLQYDLVTETRDAIGSAEAVALPQEEVLRTREQSLAALEAYVRDQKTAKDLDADTACGMFFSLLDLRGFSKTKLVDREPLRDLFVNLRKQTGKTGPDAFATALNQAMGGGCEDQIGKWGLRGDQRMTLR